MKKQIIDLYNNQDFEALSELVSSADLTILSQELALIDKELLIQIPSKSGTFIHNIFNYNKFIK